MTGSKEPGRPARRLLTVSPDHEPLWVRLYVHQIGDKWAAMIVADDAPPPEPGSLTGQAFFGETPRRSGTGGEGVSRVRGAGELKDRAFLPSRSRQAPIRSDSGRAPFPEPTSEVSQW